ncbi:MAG TPA: NAD(P)H-dependent oxidoreductase [Thermomicrobiales bacterium]|nr:NAD(P)H-dependent oxidoreductase [Thermomicrobiales bacterium]
MTHPPTQPLPRLRIIIATTRPGRVGPYIGGWVADSARATGRFTVEITDLGELGLPLFDEPEHPVHSRYTRDHTKAWSEQIRGSDAIVFVFPEYNHGAPGSLKNAIDFLSAEWAYKPVSMVTYGGASGGVRAAVGLLPTLTTLKMIAVAGSVTISGVASLMTGEGDERTFHPSELHRSMLDRVLNELARLAPLTAALRP